MGQFSRLAHQQSKYHSQSPAQILADFSLRLPPSAHSVYYYDTIGNVSTSHFRPGSAGSAGTSRRRVVDSLLELRPRYPILGGWNYSFTVGWDSPLGDALKEDATGKKVSQYENDILTSVLGRPLHHPHAWSCHRRG